MKEQKKVKRKEEKMDEDIVYRKFLVNLKISKEFLDNACVEMVTKNCRPLAMLNDTGFQKIVRLSCHHVFSAAILQRKHDINETSFLFIYIKNYRQTTKINKNKINQNYTATRKFSF